MTCHAGWCRARRQVLNTLYTAAQCRQIDRLAIEQQRIPGFTLMARAGRAAFDCLLQAWPALRSVTICCGRGNNAGDGYIVAALAREAGIGVQLLQVGDPAELRGDAALARDQALAAGVRISVDWPAAAVGDVIVDALLGTGLRGALSEPFAEAVRWVNRAGRPVLAIDLPTGVDADSGAVTDPVVRADLTVTFIGRKLGLYTGPGVTAAGRREFFDLGVAAAVYRQVPGVPLLDYPALDGRWRLPARSADAYKQSFGHVLVVGGDFSMGGAPLMASEAALRVGAGLVSTLTRGAHRPAILARRPEVMVVDADDATARQAVLARATCLVIGPGLGRSAWGVRLLRESLAAAKPSVIDADGLQLLAALQLNPAGPVVATPHPGEAAALLGCRAQDVQQDRPAAILKLAGRLGGAVVLKGAGSLLAAAPAPGVAPALLGVCAHGNPGMASAGMGDVLSGVIGGLLAQGMMPATAAVAGTCLHSLAADRAAAQLGERSLLAMDLLPEIIALLAAEPR
jgi:hydroxyethylthiazole kinase-like uncharacterized protein yjeF